MDRRKVALVLMGLALSVLSSCRGPLSQRLKTYSAEEAASERRAREQEKKCIALKGRTITIEEEYAFGSAVSVNWISQSGGLVVVQKDATADALAEQINKIGRHLAAQSSRPGLPWTFGVLDSPGINAVSGPGGYVFVSDGLLMQLDSEAELAGVLAHEISHIARRHALTEYQSFLVDECMGLVKEERMRAEKNLGVSLIREGMGEGLKGMSQALPVEQLNTLFSQLASEVNTFDFDKAGTSVIKAITNGFVSRLAEKGLAERDEYAADQDAVDLMMAAGYDPQAYIAFLGKLPDKGLSTEHPSKSKRQERLRERLQTLQKPAGENEFVRPVELAQTKRVPLRDALLARRRAKTAANTH